MFNIQVFAKKCLILNQIMQEMLNLRVNKYSTHNF
jgi:hypothetical protein